jgi:sulfite exporter TauE/SafE
MEWLPLTAAFLIGLFGSGHCVAMCGGIVGALSLPGRERGARERLLHPLAYHGGRLTSYAVAGALAGLLGSAATPWLDPALAARVASWLSALFLVLLGLYLTGAATVLGFLERAAGPLWRRVEPLGRRWLPIRHGGHAWLAGLVWGWLPCGMVYAVLSLSLGAGDALSGAARMLAFGLGTVPALLLAGVASRRLASVSAGSAWRRAAGALVVLAGVLMAWQPDWLAWPGGGHHH